MASKNPLENIVPPRAPSGAEVTPSSAKKSTPRKKTVVATEPLKTPEPPKIDMGKFLHDQARLNQDVIDETYKIKVAKISTEGRVPDFPDVPLTPEEKMNLTRVEQTLVAPKPKPAEVAPLVAPEQKSEDESAPNQQPYVFHQGDEFAAISRDWKEKGDFTKISDREKWMKISEEDLNLNAQLSEMKKGLDEFGKNYSKVAGEAGAKQGIIRKLNPFSNPEDYDEVKQALAEWQQKRDEFARAFYHDLSLKLSGGEVNEQFAKQQEHNFDALIAKEAIELHSRKYDFKKDYSAGKNWISPKIADGYNNFIGKFRKMHPALRIGAGAGIFVVGNIPATIAWRIIGGLAAGKGAHEGLQAAAELWRQRKERKDLQKFEKEMSGKNLSVQERINLRLERLERQNQGMEQRMAKYARGDYYRKFAGVLIAGLVGSGTVARLIQSTGMGGAIREKIFGGGGAATQAHEAMVAKPSAGSLPSPEPTKFSSETFEQVQKGFENANPDKHIDDAAKNLSKMFAGGVEPEVKAGGSLQNWAQTSHAAGAEVQMPEIAKPKFQEIASGEFGKGGSIEGKVMAAIEAKPEDFGLHQSDPDFATKALEMKKNIIEDFYKEKGFKSYAEFDRYCRKNVWDKDVFRIVHNPVTRDIILECKGHGFHDVFSTGDVPDVSHGGAASAAAQEVAPSKPSVSAVEDVKPKTGAVDHQPVRGGGKMKFSPEIEEMDKKAQANWSKAVQAEQEWKNVTRPQTEAMNVKDLAMANNKMFLSTRGLWENVFQGAGFSKHGNVWNSSALEVYGQLKQYIAHDVISADSTSELNENMVRLGSLFKAFGTPPKGMSMENYFRNITSNSANIELLNTLKSAPFEELAKPLRK